MWLLSCSRVKILLKFLRMKRKRERVVNRNFFRGKVLVSFRRELRGRGMRVINRDFVSRRILIYKRFGRLLGSFGI